MVFKEFYTKDPVTLAPLLMLLFIGWFTALTMLMEPRLSVGAVATWILGNAVPIGGGVRAAMLGVSVNGEGDGIVVQNWFRRYEIKWEEIEGFRIGRAPTEAMAGQVVLRDGWVVYLSDIQHRWLSSAKRARKRSARKVIERLNEELARRRGVHQ